MEPLPEPRETRPEHPTLSSGLMLGVQKMESEAWNRLVVTFGPIVYRWCRTAGVPESDAADVVQEVFTSVARGIGRFERQKSQGSFRSWLATITRNRVTDFFRKQAECDPAAGGTEALVALRQHAESLDSTICVQSAESPLVRRALESVRGEFQTPTWNAFWLTAVEGQSAADVAVSVGISVASVYQAKSRVLRRLRERLGEIPT